MVVLCGWFCGCLLFCDFSLKVMVVVGWVGYCCFGVGIWVGSLFCGIVFFITIVVLVVVLVGCFGFVLCLLCVWALGIAGVLGLVCDEGFALVVWVWVGWVWSLVVVVLGLGGFWVGRWRCGVGWFGVNGFVRLVCGFACC